MHETNDLTIGWISRLPEIDYVWSSSDPAREGWPVPGEAVTWRAHVKNWAGTLKEDVVYEWRLDGIVVSSGTVDIDAGSYVTVDFVWIWEFARHELEFVLEPQQAAGNRLVTYTDAITIGFYVEQGMYDHFHEHQHELEVGSNSFEGWAQRQIRSWNEMFERAVYPETPHGVLDRIRIQEILVQPDGIIWREPIADRRTVDLRWWIRFEFNTGPYDAFNNYLDYTQADISNPFFYDAIIFHELGHARYLKDVYAFDVFTGGRYTQVSVLESGTPVAGSRYMPFVGSSSRGNAVFHAPERGLMKSHAFLFIDRYSAVALNLIAGHRATMGNKNAPANVGSYMWDLPAENRLTVRDELGRPLPRAKVAVYQDDLIDPNPYGMYYDDSPDLEFTADGEGTVLLGRDPFALEDYHAEMGEPKPITLILRVEHAAGVGYGFLPAYLFNLEYWRGNTEQGEYDLCVSLIP
jgi:hypothetical protein